MSKILVTGASGFLGGSMALKLLKMGLSPIGMDREPLSKPLKNQFPFYQIDLCDRAAIQNVLAKETEIDAVIHFAALALVSESTEKPLLYLKNNLLSTINIATAALDAGITNFVHSSSCSVYGEPEKTPITETFPLHPVSPYGESKRIGEEILLAISKRGLKTICLRYFNPAGSIAGNPFGENHEPETHLIPNVVRSALLGEPVGIYGADYKTADGTCIRDFIHVEDLLDGHILALQYLTKASLPFDVFNIGAGTGKSVMEVIRASEKVIGKEIKTKILPKRAGDPPILISDISKIQSILNWKPQLHLEEMIRDHYSWVRNIS